MLESKWSRILAGLTIMAPIPYVVSYADVYLTEDQAAAVLFPGIKLEAKDLDLTPAEAKQIQSASGERVSKPRLRLWQGPTGEMMFVDRVLGKHEFITYAVAVNADGTVKGVEIMQYNETYGYQIREEKWRRQFAGKSSADQLKLTRDISNISGATLSCSHVTKGVRRVLHTFNTLKARAS